MSYSTRKQAYDEGDAGKEVWCPECEKETRLVVEDNSFSHAFGTEYRYDIVTECCGSDEWDERGPCKFAVKLPSGRYACDMKDEDICQCDGKLRADCSAFEEKPKVKGAINK